MSQIGSDSGRFEPVHQLQAIHHAVRRSIAHIAKRGGHGSAAQALSDSYLRGDLESLAEVTQNAGRLSGASLDGVAGLLSELNGVLAYASTLGESVSDAQRTAIQRRVNAIVGTIGRLSGSDPVTDIESARQLASGIRRELLSDEPEIVGDSPEGTTLDLAA